MLDAVSSITNAIEGAGAASGLRAAQAATAAGPAAGPSFSQVLSDVAASGVDALRQGEAMAVSGLDGKASVQQVVEAVMSAEQALQTAIAIRDKVVAAYQEIGRMAI